MEQTGNAKKEQKTNYSALKTQKQYLKLIVANIINRFGDSIDAIAFSWMMYQITGSASLMALILGLNYIPTILLQPIAGVLVDHMDKKRIMVWTDIGRGAVVAACVLLHGSNALTPLLLAVMTMLNSTLEAFRVPAGLAVTPKILDEELYTVGEAAISTASRIAELAGLAAAGAVVTLLGTSGALWIDAATFVISALLIAWMRVSESKNTEKIDLSGVWTGFSEGVRFIKAEKLMIALLGIGMLINFCMVPFNVFGTPFVVDYMKKGPELLSMMNIAMVIGMGIGSFVMPKLHRIENRTLLVTSGVLTGFGCMAMYLIPEITNDVTQIAVLLAALGVTGLGVGVINVIFGAAFMRFIPQEMLGRMGGLTNAVLCASLPVGSFLCSALAAAAPVPVVMLISGMLTVVLYCCLLGVKELKRL